MLFRLNHSVINSGKCTAMMFHIYNRHYNKNGWMFPLNKSLVSLAQLC